MFKHTAIRTPEGLPTGASPNPPPKGSDLPDRSCAAETGHIVCYRNALIPSPSEVVESYLNNSQSLFLTKFVMETAAGNLNHGMRFTNHRRLHDADSLKRMASLCGFTAVATPCAMSNIVMYSGFNRRDEGNSALFEMDLYKTQHISRLTMVPVNLTGFYWIKQDSVFQSRMETQA
jgi:hypothetical protein